MFRCPEHFRPLYMVNACGIAEFYRRKNLPHKSYSSLRPSVVASQMQLQILRPNSATGVLGAKQPNVNHQKPKQGVH